MIKVLYIRIPEHVEQENLFVCLQNFVSGECYNEVLGYKNGKAALRRLLGEALVGFALREYWNLPLETYRIARGEKGKPFIVGREDVFFLMIAKCRAVAQMSGAPLGGIVCKRI